MTDTDKTARDAAIQQIDKSLAGRPLTSFEQLLICRGWNAALAHAETQHAERVNGLRDLLEELLIWNLCKFHLLEQGLQIDWSKADMACAFCDRAYRIKQTLAEYRKTEDANE